MSKPIVAIVGRPNVGKSTLFNALAGEKISIVKDTPGVTRDRIYADVSWLDYNFTIIDTGGIEPESDNIILKSMREQAEIAIETADVIIFMTDVRQGLVDDDHTFSTFMCNTCDLRILICDTLCCINDQNRYITSFNSRYSTDDTVTLNIFFDLALSSKSCSINKHILRSISDDFGIDRISCRSGNIRYDHTVFTQKLIDDR